jgi:hypothetical protein
MIALLTGTGKGLISAEILRLPRQRRSCCYHHVALQPCHSRVLPGYLSAPWQQRLCLCHRLVLFNRAPSRTSRRSSTTSTRPLTRIPITSSTLDTDPDHILPFAAVPGNGRESDGLDDKPELAHRIMPASPPRFLGSIKIKNSQSPFRRSPTQIILPLPLALSLLGNYGLYPESKISRRLSPAGEPRRAGTNTSLC